jgi:hypothetical protein
LRLKWAFWPPLECVKYPKIGLRSFCLGPSGARTYGASGETCFPCHWSRAMTGPKEPLLSRCLQTTCARARRPDCSPRRGFAIFGRAGRSRKGRKANLLAVGGRSGPGPWARNVRGGGLHAPQREEVRLAIPAGRAGDDFTRFALT